MVKWPWVVVAWGVVGHMVWVVAGLWGDLVMVVRWWRGCGGFGVWCGGSYGSGVEERKIWWIGFWVFFLNFFLLLGLGIGFCLGSKKEMLFNFFE